MSLPAFVEVIREPWRVRVAVDGIEAEAASLADDPVRQSRGVAMAARPGRPEVRETLLPAVVVVADGGP